MAEWVSHLMVADKVLEALSWLKRHEFCVGNIAPDCNIPNEDWTAFTPSREITHWMQAGKRKNADDCKRFYEEYITKKIKNIGKGGSRITASPGSAQERNHLVVTISVQAVLMASRLRKAFSQSTPRSFSIRPSVSTDS